METDKTINLKDISGLTLSELKDLIRPKNSMIVDDLIGLKIVGIKQVFAEENKRGKIIFKILDDSNPDNKIYWILSHHKGVFECKGNILNTLGFPIVWINLSQYDNTPIIDYYTQNKELVILRLFYSEFDIEVISDSLFYSRYYDRLHNDLICLKRQGDGDNFVVADTLNKHIITYYPSILCKKEQKK